MRRITFSPRFAIVLLAVVPGCSSEAGANDVDASAGAPIDSGPPRCVLNDTPDLGPSGDGAAPCGDVWNGIIRETCVGGICHHAGKTPAAHLNLLSPCVADRLVGVTSSCNGRLIVDPAHVEASFILDKLRHDKPECGGESMPYDNHLPPAELGCVERWVAAIAAEGARDSDGAP